MSVARYSILVLGVALATLGLAWPLGLRWLDPAARSAVGFGVAVAIANTAAAHALARWSEGRATVSFMRAVLGGTLGRLTFMLAALVVGVRVLGLPRTPLAVSLLSYFVCFLIMELSIFHWRIGAPSGGAR